MCRLFAITASLLYLWLGEFRRLPHLYKVWFCPKVLQMKFNLSRACLLILFGWVNSKKTTGSFTMCVFLLIVFIDLRCRMTGHSMVSFYYFIHTGKHVMKVVLMILNIY